MKEVLGAAKLRLGLALGRAGAHDDRQRRDARLLEAVLTAAAGRSIAIVVSLLSVPLAVRYLGAERFGAWVTLSTLLAWLQLADLGLGNGLTNSLSEAYGTGRRELARAHVATAIWLLAGLAAVLGAAVAALWPFVDWAAVFNVHSDVARSEIGRATGLALALLLVGFPLTLLDKIYAAHQEGAVGNLWSGAANLASLGSLVAVTQTRGGMVWLVAAFSGTRLLVTTASAVWLFARHMPELRPAPRFVDRSSARRLLSEGGQLFVVQIAALLIFETDNLVITQVLGPEQVTPYNVAWRLFTIPTLAVTLLFPYLWPAYVEAFTRGDAPWVKRTFHLSLWGGGALALALAAPLVLLGQEIAVRWAGPPAEPPFSLLCWMGAWAVMSAMFSAISCMLNASGRVRGQVVFGTATAVANVALSIHLARLHGITGVIAATVIAYLLFALVPLGIIETRLALARLQRS